MEIEYKQMQCKKRNRKQMPGGGIWNKVKLRKSNGNTFKYKNIIAAESALEITKKYSGHEH